MKYKFNHLFYGIVIMGLVCFTACKKDSGTADQTPDPEVPENPENPKPAPELANWESGDVFFDDHKWTEAIAGDMPLVISVPHGGDIKPSSVPDRTCDDATTVTDLYTRELARAIEKELVEEYNIRPYLVLCHLKRTKIDQNRPLSEGTCGNPEMQTAWHQFHDYVDTALNLAVAEYGRAIYIDLHGHGHSKQRLEIGYNLTKNELVQIAGSGDLLALKQKSSIQNLFLLNTGLDFREMMTGDEAFGTLMQNEGFNSVPSKQDPYPLSGDTYFNGGDNTRMYTGKAYPNVYGWQIECNKTGVRDTEASRAAFAKAFAKNIVHYLEHTKS